MSIPRGWARAAGKALLPDLIRQGMSQAESLRHLIKVGYSYRRQDMQKDYRQISGVLKYEKYWSNAPRSTLPNKNMMSEVDLKYPERYKAYFRVRIDNAWTGQEEEAILSAYVRDFQTIEEVEKDMADVWAEKYGDLVSAWLSVKLISVEHNRGFGY